MYVTQFNLSNFVVSARNNFNLLASMLESYIVMQLFSEIWKTTATTAQPTILITLTTVETEPYPFIFPPGFDSNEDEGR